MKEETAVRRARRLIQQAQQELEDETIRRKVLELIETILVYKLPRMSREEIEAMFSLSDLKQTRVYQEAKQEGEQEAKLKAVPRLLALGLSVKQIAAALEMDVEVVKQVASGQ